MGDSYGHRLPTDPVPWLEIDRPIRVSVPAEVAFNLDSLQNSIANLAKRLGCEACFSGRSCYFTLERDYVINPQSLEVESIVRGGF